MTDNIVSNFITELIAEKYAEDKDAYRQILSCMLGNRSSGKIITKVEELKNISGSETKDSAYFHFANNNRSIQSVSITSGLIPEADILRINIEDESCLIFQKDFIHARFVYEFFQKKADIFSIDQKTGDKKLYPAQSQAMYTVFNSAVTVITGGPGTGKTTLINELLEYAEKIKCNVSLAAPTGKAVMRIQQVASSKGKVAQTIHRLMQSGRDGTFRRNGFHPLNTQMLIIDECSMLTTEMLVLIMKALPSQAKLVLIGDCDQLPPVEGPGIFSLFSIILPNIARFIVQLDVSKRFSRNFQEKVNTLLEKGGKQANFPEERSRKPFADLFTLNRDSIHFVALSEVEMNFYAAQFIKFTVQKNIWSFLDKNKLNSLNITGLFLGNPEWACELHQIISHCIVLTPFSASQFLGDNAISIFINEEIYSNDRSNDIKDLKIYPVMMKRNSYRTGLFNGEAGFCIEIAQNRDYWFEDSIKGIWRKYPGLHENDLAVSWAITVHKSQGSEYDHILMLLPKKSGKVMTPNALYTGITRAKKSVIICGNREELNAIPPIHSPFRKQVQDPA